MGAVCTTRRLNLKASTRRSRSTGLLPVRKSTTGGANGSVEFISTNPLLKGCVTDMEKGIWKRRFAPLSQMNSNAAVSVVARRVSRIWRCLLNPSVTVLSESLRRCCEEVWDVYAPMRASDWFV